MRLLLGLVCCCSLIVFSLQVDEKLEPWSASLDRIPNMFCALMVSTIQRVARTAAMQSVHVQERTLDDWERHRPSKRPAVQA